MKIALTGATGYLGSFTAAHLLRDARNEVLSLTRVPHPVLSAFPRFRECAFSADWKGAVAGFSPEAIIHCAAMASAAECEAHPGEAFAANEELTREIGRVSRECGAHFVAVSTDLVFDGNEPAPPGGFSESAKPAPSSVYSRSKRAGEEAALKLDAGVSVMRTSLLYGPAFGPKSGPLGWLRDGLGSGRRVTLFSDEWRTPVCVMDAAAALVEAARARQSGIFHAAGRERLSRLEFGRIIANGLGLDTGLIDAKKRHDAKSVPFRPEDVSLDPSGCEQAFKIHFRKVAEAIGLLEKYEFTNP